MFVRVAFQCCRVALAPCVAQQVERRQHIAAEGGVGGQGRWHDVGHGEDGVAQRRRGGRGDGGLAQARGVGIVEVERGAVVGAAL